jgi:hypothetical protein
MGVIWTMRKQGHPVTPATLAKESGRHLNLREDLVRRDFEALRERGLLTELADGSWDFTEAGWRYMD